MEFRYSFIWNVARKVPFGKVISDFSVLKKCINKLSIMLYIHKMFYVHIISYYRIYFANLSSLAICIEKVMGVVGGKKKKNPLLIICVTWQTAEEALELTYHNIHNCCLLGSPPVISRA